MQALRLVDRLHLDFVMKGARFDAHAQKRNAAIMERLSILETQFSQNVLADETEFTIVLKREDLSGCPEDLIAAARQAAIEREKAADECVFPSSCLVFSKTRSRGQVLHVHGGRQGKHASTHI